MGDAARTGCPSGRPAAWTAVILFTFGQSSSDCENEAPPAPRLWADFLVSLLRTTQPKKIFLLVMATDSPLGWEEERGRRAGEPREVTQRLKTNPRYSSVSQSVVPKTPHPSPGMWVKVQILES